MYRLATVFRLASVHSPHRVCRVRPLIGVSISHVTVLRDLQPSKQRSPKLVTEDGMVIDVRKEQPEYLEVIDYQLFAVNTVEKWIGYYLWV